MRIFTLLAAILVFGIWVFCAPQASRGDIYRRVDENGVVHFTNRPSGKGYHLFIRERTDGRPRTDQERFRPFEPLIKGVARQYGLDATLVKALIKVESDIEPLAVSKKGALGLMQLMPETAQRLGVRDPKDPAKNIEAGARHLRRLLDTFRGRLRWALAAYNAGEKAVIRHGGIPPYPETRRFIQKVIRYYKAYRLEGI